MAQAAGLLDESLTGLSLQQFFTMHTSQALLTRQVDDVDLITQEVAKHSVERRLGPGHRLFSFGEAPDSFYLILKVPAHTLLRLVACRVLLVCPIRHLCFARQSGSVMLSIAHILPWWPCD